MKRCTLALPVLLLLMQGLAHAQHTTPLAWGDQGNGTFRNPVLKSDYSDPDILRHGDDFYLIASDFHFVGIQVLHSKDLVNWRVIGQVFDRLDMDARYDDMKGYGEGTWAPALRYHDGEFYIFVCTPSEGVFMWHAKNPAGPWSKTVTVKAVPRWEDPCPFWDDDGQAYLVHSYKGAGPLILHKMSADGTRLLDEGKEIYRGKVAEGPKLFKRKGYYYISLPEGGVEKGGQTVLRSKDIYGPYERRQVLPDGSPHQGGLVELANGDTWFMSFKSTGYLGRICYLNPVTWTDDDWPVFGDNGRSVDVWKKPNVGKTYPVARPQTSDEFDARVLSPIWQWNHNPVPDGWSLTARAGYLRLKALPESGPDPLRNAPTYGPDLARNTLTQKLWDGAGVIDVKLDAASMRDGQRAGFAFMSGSDFGWVGVKQEKGVRKIASYQGEGPILTGRQVWLRGVNDGETARLLYSQDGKTYSEIDGVFQLRFRYWKGARIAIFSCGPNGGAADFDYVHYRYGSTAEALGAGRPSKATTPPPAASSRVQPAGAATAAYVELPSQVPLRAAAAQQRSALRLDGLYFETATGRTPLPAGLTAPLRKGAGAGEAKMPDGRVVRLAVSADGRHRTLRLSAEPAGDIRRWGLAIDAAPDEYFTGLMERVVDGPQNASWAPGITAAMDLRGQRVDMIVKPTTSVYAPFYLSSRGYGVFVKGTWPGRFGFCVDAADRVNIDFEGPSLEMKIYFEPDPAALVRDHAIDAGPPILPPKWAFTPIRWRDEHSQLTQYYDGTPVTGPFNSQVMEDVLLMKAYGIPNGVYWVDRPWGPGRLGYDDFEIDPKRLPHFAEMVQWLNGQGTQMMLWIAPFFQGQMERDALAKGYQLAGQPPQPNNYPLADLTNPAARAFWQAGFSKLLKLGVAAFKLDRGEENIPEEGPYTVFDGRSIREQRNAYPVMFVQAAYEEAKKLRGDDFLLMPRGAYTGSARYGAFWGGDIGGTEEGLRASIIAVQRAAVMGYPTWGSDTCGYNQQLMEQEVCARWLAFSAFTPIMEVGPTRNAGFWNLPRNPSYDEVLIATWRLYARLHERLVDYSYRHAREAASTGMPIVRPLFLVEPGAPQAWTNWTTYLYGADILVSPIWEKGRREATVYLPSGARWRDAWHRDRVYDGGRAVTVTAEIHQIPLFVREGSGIDLGDLDREYADAQAAARQRPDLKALDAGVAAWFAQRKEGK